MEEYLQQKYNWNTLEQELIAWKEVAQALKQYTEFKKSKIIQLMYNWQNDGEQKSYFQESSNVECPAKCGEIESHQHYLHCNATQMKNVRLEIHIHKLYRPS